MEESKADERSSLLDDRKPNCCGIVGHNRQNKYLAVSITASMLLVALSVVALTRGSTADKDAAIFLLMVVGILSGVSAAALYSRSSMPGATCLARWLNCSGQDGKSDGIEMKPPPSTDYGSTL